jgi:hypothetical protein
LRINRLSFPLATLLCFSPALLRADFTYQETTQMTGGSLMTMMKALGPLTRGAREPIVSTHIVKGNRMATITKDRVSVIDLDKETITTIDKAKKTYSVMTFAQMKQAMEDAANRRAEKAEKAESKKGDQNSDVKAQFKVSAKATGQTKIVQGLNAKEMLMTFTMEGTDTKSGDKAGMDMTSNVWYAPVPGYDEVKEFHKRMAGKLSYMFGSSMQQMMQMSAQMNGQGNNPQMSQSMEEFTKELSKIDGVPVETHMTMGASGAQAAGSSSSSSTASAPPPQQRQESAGSAIAGAALGRLGGFGRKRKSEEPQQQQTAEGDQPAPQTASGSLMEMTTSLTSFSSGPADGSQFDVPAGYKQGEPDMRRAPR